MSKSFLLVLLVLCGEASGQWVEIATSTRDGHREIGSGVIVGSLDGRPVIIGCGHQFRDANSEPARIDGKNTATVLFRTLATGADISILQMDQQVSGIRPASIGATPDGEIDVAIYRGEESRRGKWAPWMSSGGGRMNMTLKGGMLQAPVAGVVSGWSGAPVYDGNHKLIGIVSAATDSMVVWTPIEQVVMRLKQCLPALFVDPAQASRTIVYIATTAGCAPCEQVKRDVTTGALARDGIEYRFVRHGSSELREVTQRIESAGYRSPRVFPWFWVPKCNCEPLAGYRGAPWLLSWLPPPFIAPPQAYRRSDAAKREPLPEFVPPVSLPPEPDPRFDAMAAKLEQSQGHYAALKDHFDATVAELRKQREAMPEAASVTPEAEGGESKAAAVIHKGGELVADVMASTAEGSPAASAGPLDPLIYGATGGTGVAVIWGLRAASAFYRRRKARKTGEVAPEASGGFPVLHSRDTEEARQLVRLGQMEGRDPLLDSIMGISFSDTLDRDIDNPDMPDDLKRYARELRNEVKARVDAAAPLSTGRPYSGEWRDGV